MFNVVVASVHVSEPPPFTVTVPVPVHPNGVSVIALYSVRSRTTRLSTEVIASQLTRLLSVIRFTAASPAVVDAYLQLRLPKLPVHSSTIVLSAVWC